MTHTIRSDSRLDVEDARRMRAAWATCAEIGARFGVSHVAASKALQRPARLAVPEDYRHAYVKLSQAEGAAVAAVTIAMIDADAAPRARPA